MPMETYVARVLAGEALRDSQPAALEALAITIRTFALANRGASSRRRLRSLRPDALPGGAHGGRRDRARRAGDGGPACCCSDGAPASIYYSASCGGRTQLPSDVWPGAEDPPFLPSKDDDACQGAPAWTAELHESDLQRALRASGFRGDDCATSASRRATRRAASRG